LILSDRFSWVCIFVVVIHLFITGWASAIHPVPVGQDFRWHMNLSRDLAAGNFSAFVSDGVAMNGMPYPPLFHLVFVVPVWLGGEALFGRFLQFLLFPATLGIFILIAHRWRGSEFAMYVALFLSAGTGFFDRGFQVIPQAFELLLLGLALWFFLEERFSLSLIAIALMFGFHAPVSWILALPFIVLGLVFHVRGLRSDVVFPWWIFLVSVPLMMFLAPFAFDAVSTHTGILSEQKAFALSRPLIFAVSYTGPVFFFGLPFLLRLRWRSMDLLDHFMALLAVAMLSLIPLWPDRVPTYIVIPLAFLIPSALGERRNDFFPVAIVFAGIGLLAKFLLVPLMG